MNFNAVDQAKGQKDGQYPQKIDMYGTLVEIGGTYFNQNQTPCSKCKIVDDNQIKHNVTILKTIPATNLLNTRQAFSLYAYDGNYQGKPYVGYSGFWVDNPQRHQQAPQGAAQSPQNRPQSTQAPQGGTNAEDCRAIAWNAACSVAAQSSEMTTDDIEQLAIAGAHFIATGQAKPVGQDGQPNPDYDPNYQPPSDDIPF